MKTYIIRIVVETEPLTKKVKELRVNADTREEARSFVRDAYAGSPTKMKIMN